MLKIDTSDCCLEIGVGRKFTRTLVWHFARFLRENLAERFGTIGLEAEIIDREARKLASHFIADMRDTLRKMLADRYEELDNLSPEGIVDLYVRENLADFEADYLENNLSGFDALYGGALPPAAIIEQVEAASAAVAMETCH
ncbi:MAG: hypothetical protein WCO00_01045 [Rhodospirillaceae bacterium]